MHNIVTPPQNNPPRIPFRFTVLHRSRKSRARVGIIHTPHGIIETPNFVAVGTNATLKGLDSHLTSTLGLQLMFCNTYHLMLQPGTSVVKSAGGLHSFINRPGPIITDSGGFQVFSLAYGSVADELKSRGTKKTDGSVLSITEEGVTFRSYRDGQKILLTPEGSVSAQKDLGADIIIPLDELPPYHLDRRALAQSVERSHRWEARSLAEHLISPNNQAMYAVVHGGVDQTLRAHSVATLSRLPFDGYAVGGSLGKTKEELYELIKFLFPLLPEDKPNHLLGIGDLPSIEVGVTHGVDTFDSSHPTRCARHGLLFTTRGNRKILSPENKLLFRPIDEDCTCPTCQRYTLAYLHHLFKAKEMTGLYLASVHNVHFMVQLMAAYRLKILDGEI